MSTPRERIRELAGSPELAERAEILYDALAESARIPIRCHSENELQGMVANSIAYRDVDPRDIDKFSETLQKERANYTRLKVGAFMLEHGYLRIAILPSMPAFNRMTNMEMFRDS